MKNKCEHVGSVCCDGVYGADGRQSHLLRAVRLNRESENVLFEGGLEAAAAHDSKEDQEPSKGLSYQANDPGSPGGGQGQRDSH